jgi:hypothetical protein
MEQLARPGPRAFLQLLRLSLCELVCCGLVLLGLIATTGARGQEGSRSWSSWNETKDQVTTLYRTSQFMDLEAALKDASLSQKTFLEGDSPAAAAYWAFRLMVPAPGFVEPHQMQVTRWKSVVPKSVFVDFLRARIAYANAWNARGSGGSSSVSPESWDLFYIRLDEAEQILVNAPEELKGSPLWHNLLLAIVLDNPKSANKPDAVLERAAKRWPRYFELYELRLTRMVPKWGGNWADVEAFIEGWNRKLAATEGASLYARLYISFRNQNVTPNETAMNWTQMKAGLEDLTRRYPSTLYKNLRASYACNARDKDAFRSALAQLAPSEIDSRSWLSGHSYDACMRWAGV